MLNNGRKMTPYLRKDELHIIFKYLNGMDLHNASQVCSFWAEIAKEENRMRHPTCVVKNELIPRYFSWEIVKTKFIDCYQVKPCLHMFFYGFGYKKEIPEGCPCKYLPLNCISISIEHFFSWFKDNSISNIFFPELSNVQISTITFNKHPWNKGTYCEELKCLFDDSFSNADRLKNMFEPIVNNNLSTSGCMILMYNTDNNDILLKLAKSLEKWFPNGKTSILGLGTNEISICSSAYNSHVCKHRADCIAILLNGTDMQSWTLVIDASTCYDETIDELKNEIKLKKHAICFVTSGERSENYYNCHGNKLFQKHFPNVPIFQLYGNEAIARNNIQGLHQNLSNRYCIEDTTGFLLITYN